MCRFNSGVNWFSLRKGLILISTFSSSSDTSYSKTSSTTGVWSEFTWSFCFTTFYIVRPDVSYFCDLDYDPFLVMQDNDKVYGLFYSLWYPTCVSPPHLQGSLCHCSNTRKQSQLCGMPRKVYFHCDWEFDTIFHHALEFIKENPQYLPSGNSMGFLSDNGGETYNRCHCTPIWCSLVVPIHSDSFISSLEQLWNWRPGFLERRSVHEVLRVPGQKRRFLLWGKPVSFPK